MFKIGEIVGLLLKDEVVCQGEILDIDENEFYPYLIRDTKNGFVGRYPKVGIVKI